MYGRHFTIRTDHAALTYLHKFSGNNARLLRWSLRLAEYDFTVQYRPGTKIPHIDSLSRYICAVSGNETLPKEREKQAQASDAFRRTMRPGSQNCRSEYFKYLEEVTYKRRQGKEPVLVVPQSLIREVISLNHDSIYASHPGWKRTLDIVSLRNWLPVMHKDVRQYVLKCDACQRRSGKHELKAAFGDVAEPSYAFQVAHCDILGPIPLSNRGNRYVLTFVDKLTKYAEAIPLADVSAVTCARAYATQIVARHGVNEVLVTDHLLQ
jgi:hypothetical protein